MLPILVDSEQNKELKQTGLPWDDWGFPRYPKDMIRNRQQRRRMPEDFREQVKSIVDFYRPKRRKGRTRRGASNLADLQRKKTGPSPTRRVSLSNLRAN